MKKFPKLNLICSRDTLRPALRHVYVTKEKCVATNGMAMVVVPTDEIFSVVFINRIPDSGVLIHRGDWKKMKGMRSASWVSDDVIKVLYDEGRPKIFEVSHIGKGKDIEDYPDWNKVMNSLGDADMKDRIGVMPSQFRLICKALGIHHAELRFKPGNNPIVIANHVFTSSALAVLAPLDLSRNG